MGNRWTFEDAEHAFAALMDAARNGEPQHVTRRGQDAVVVLSSSDYQKLRNGEPAGKTLGSFADHILAFPKLPDDCQDLFDDRDRYASTDREIGIGD